MNNKMKKKSRNVLRFKRLQKHREYKGTLCGAAETRESQSQYLQEIVVRSQH